MKEDGESHDSEEKQTLITRNDLEAISSEIINLEKENETEAKNVKRASPAKPKPVSQRHKLNNKNNNRNNPSPKHSNVNTAKDYGDFDFCVAKRTLPETKGGTKNEVFATASNAQTFNVDESFPRRRRPINGFQQNSNPGRNRSRHDSDDILGTETKAGTNDSEHNIACKTCLCALLISVSLIGFALLVFLHPSVQIYIRSHIHYINPLNSPV